MKIVAFFFSNNLTPADGMRPNREANTVANVTVKPSVVGVPTCNTSIDVKSARLNLSTSRKTTARYLARPDRSRSGVSPSLLKTWASHTATMGRSVSATNSGKPRRATVADTLLFISNQPNQKESNMMNKIMVSLFAVLIAAFSLSAVMRERVKADAECRMMEVAR